MSDHAHCFSVPVEMLEAYKIKLMNDIEERLVPLDHDGQALIEVPHQLLFWLINQAQAWQRLEHDELTHQGGRP